MSGSFWDFSLGFYMEPRAQAACLALQDEAGCDVNLVLYCLFRGIQGDALPVQALAELDALVEPIRRLAVVPLRQIRREMKAEGFDPDPDAFERLREDVKRAELQSEKLVQQLLGAASPQTVPAEPFDAVRANLDGYASLIGAALPAAHTDVLLARLRDIS